MGSLKVKESDPHVDLEASHGLTIQIWECLQIFVLRLVMSSRVNEPLVDGVGMEKGRLQSIMSFWDSFLADSF